MTDERMAGTSIENVQIEINDVLSELSDKIAALEVEVATQKAINQSILRTNAGLKESLERCAAERIRLQEQMETQEEPDGE